MSEQHVLDNPIRSSLLGPHAHFAVRNGSVLRYPPDVCPFIALPDEPDTRAWADLAALVGPDATAAVSAPRIEPPPGWGVVADIAGVQFVDAGVAAEPDPEAVVLRPADAPEMLALVKRTRPGPFLPRTVEMGTYLGIRHDGELIAMAGERLHPPGWTEISAARTSATAGAALPPGSCEPSSPGYGSAARPRCSRMLAASNVNAIRLYESLGFALRRHTRFVGVRVLAGEAVA